jgi:apolipoprotein N-acyltransferase
MKSGHVGSAAPESFRVDASKKALRVWPWLAAIATGLLYRACFAPFDQAWFCWFALTPLLCAVWFSGEEAKRRWLRDLLLGYVAGLAFFWSVFSWLTTVTVPGWIIVGIYMAVYPAAFAWLCGMLRPKERPVVEKPLTGLDAVTRRIAEKRAAAAGVEIPTLNAPSPLSNSPWLSSVGNLRLAFLLASAWVATEMLRGTVFSGWGWNMLGSALHGQWALIQIVEYTGVPGCRSSSRS